GLWRGGARGEAARECHEVGAQGDEWDQPGQRGDAGVDRRGGDPLAQPSRATSRGFFFQAEDGIRDYKVTGVQTCALPIYSGRIGAGALASGAAMTFEDILDQAMSMLQRRGRLTYRTLQRQFQLDEATLEDLKEELIRSEERRVGKECRYRWGRGRYKKREV